VQERGLAAYLVELIGTFLLVFFITSVIVLFVATGNQAQFGSDFAVVGLAQGFTLFAVIIMFGMVSGGHFNPAVTFAFALLKRISPIDAVVYVLAQLIGAVLGALLTKALLTEAGRATHYGAGQVSALLSGSFAGAVVETIGTFCLVLVILVVLLSKKGAKEWGPLAIGTTLAFLIMVAGPLTVGCFNPARWFGPALVGNSWGSVWPYLLGPIVGSLLAVAAFHFLIEGGRLMVSGTVPKKPDSTPPTPGPASKPETAS